MSRPRLASRLGRGAGDERERIRLAPQAWGFDYDPSGTHQLLVSDDAAYRRSGGQVTRIPAVPAYDSPSGDGGTNTKQHPGGQNLISPRTHDPHEPWIVVRRPARRG